MLPMMMFWGFPVIVATLPIFDAVAIPTDKDGISFQPTNDFEMERCHYKANRSLTRNAERNPGSDDNHPEQRDRPTNMCCNPMGRTPKEAR